METRSNNISCGKLDNDWSLVIPGYAGGRDTPDRVTCMTPQPTRFGSKTSMHQRQHQHKHRKAILSHSQLRLGVPVLTKVEDRMGVAHFNQGPGIRSRYTRLGGCMALALSPAS